MLCNVLITILCSPDVSQSINVFCYARMIFGDMTCWVSQNGKFAPYFYDFLDFLYNMWYTLCVDKILTRFSALVGLKYEQSETKTNNAVSVEKNYRRTTTKVSQK